MSVPDVAVAGALLAIARWAMRLAVVVAIDELLLALVCSGGFGALHSFPTRRSSDLAGLMCTTIVKVWVALGASVPKLQVTVPAVVVQPALAETTPACTGRPSVTVPPLEVEGPLLVTVRE